MKPQVRREHYFAGYDNPNRFASYWHQIDETSRLGGRVIEIGIGNGTVAAVLRARGLEVTTVDIDPDLDPDVVADIRELPFPDDAFDTALAAEVLEHLPWETVSIAMGELMRIARRGVVISVPNSDVAFSLDARLPNVIQLFRLAVRRRLPLRNALWAATQRPAWRRSGGPLPGFAEIARLNQKPLKCDEHFWELGARGIFRKDFVAVAEGVGLRLVHDFRAPRFPIHHFFVFTRPAANQN